MPNITSDTLQVTELITTRTYRLPAVRRSSYSEINAESIKPVIIKLQDSEQDVFISARNSGYSVNTLYVKFNDGLKWLIDNIKDDNTYKDIRTRVSVRKLEDGILVYFKNSYRVRSGRPPLTPDLAYTTDNKSLWRGEIKCWLEKAKEGTLYEQTIILDEEDRQWIENTVSALTPDAELEFKDNKVRILR